MSSIKRPETKLVPVPSVNKIPERDVDKSPILEAQHLGIDFGGLTAVNEFNMAIGRTEIAGLIGPNGAGKTTVFNLLTKVYQPTRGTVLLDGVDTHNMNTVQVNKAGIARTFQNIRLFNNLSVEDNVKIGMHNSIHCGLFSGILRLPRYWKEEKTAHERALELLSIFHMQDLAGAKAGSLPYGAQRRLEIIRALGTNPSLLLLDEPAAGMNPSETAELMENIVKIRDTFQIAILLIEHDMNLVMGICEGICVLNFGQIIAKGTPTEIQNNPEVITAPFTPSRTSPFRSTRGRLSPSSAPTARARLPHCKPCPVCSTPAPAPLSSWGSPSRTSPPPSWWAADWPRCRRAAGSFSR